MRHFQQIGDFIVWPYFRGQIILRHAAWMDVSVQNINNKVTYGHLLKFLPLAFWLVYEQPHNFLSFQRMK